MLIDAANPGIVRKTLEQFESLLTLEYATGTKTNKTRNQLLQSLQPAELVAVSVELKRLGLIEVAR